MSELSFLLDLLLNHKLPKATKEAITARVKEVEANINSPTFSRIETRPQVSYQVVSGTNNPTNQAPSTLALLEKHGLLAPTIGMVPQQPSLPVTGPLAPSVPVTQIAQTQAAVAAMNSRETAIAESLAGKIDKTTGRPRKF